MTDTSQLRLPYAGKDYEQILEEIKQKIPSLTDEWSDFLESDIGYALIRMQAALTDFNMFYLDQQAAETFLSTCKLRESAVARAKSLGYSPKQLTPATTIARFSLQSAYNKQITIPYGTTVTIQGIQFYVAEDAPIPAGSLYADVLVRQGSIYTTDYMSSGTKWYKIPIPVNVAEAQVFVDGVEWTEVDSFIYTNTPTCFKMAEDYRGMVIQFGGGTTAEIPPQGSRIAITGTLCDGIKGNLAQANLTVVLIDTIQDPDGEQVTQLLQGVTLAPAVSGSDAEGIQEIKDNAPAFYTTQNRAVTADDYVAIARKVSGVEGVSGWGGEEVGRYGEVYVCVYGADKANVPQPLIDAVVAALDSKRTIPMLVNVVAPVPVRVNMVADLYLSQFANIASVRNEAFLAISGHLDSFDIGQTAQQSDLAAIISESSDIDYVNISFTCSMDSTIISGVVDVKLPFYVSQQTLSIVKDGVQIWEDGEGVYSFSNARLYVELEGDGVQVEIRFSSTFADIYPARTQLLVPGNIILNTYRSNQPESSV